MKLWEPLFKARNFNEEKQRNENRNDHGNASRKKFSRKQYNQNKLYGQHYEKQHHNENVTQMIYI